MEAKLDHIHLPAAYVPRGPFRNGMLGPCCSTLALTNNQNVDAFDPHPSIKWYWIAAVPMVSGISRVQSIFSH